MTKSPHEGQDKILGVFSTQKVTRVGTGTTSRRMVQQGYYYAQELDSGEIEIQPLNNDHLPSGHTETISKEDLLAQYSPEPELYQSTVYPKLREVNKTLARADRHRKRGETFSAEMEYSNALKIDEQNVRGNFGIGLCYLARGEEAKAGDILKRLVTLEGAFEEKHKHMFNEFGINLRKSKMYDQAVEYYERAAEVGNKKDENLFFNLARAYFEKGQFKEAKEALEQALTINPDFNEAHRMIEAMQKKGLV